MGAGPAIQQTDYWLTVIFSGIAAVGGAVGAGGGVFSAIYSAGFTRRKAERELLAGKLETLYSELKDELIQTYKSD